MSADEVVDASLRRNRRVCGMDILTRASEVKSGDDGAGEREKESGGVRAATDLKTLGMKGEEEAIHVRNGIDE